MHLALVNPPSCFHDATDIAPPLGLLLLATVVERDTPWKASVLDFNLDMVSGRAPAEGEAFYEWAVDRIKATQPDLVGFTSMCLESHVVLKLAGRLKDAVPDVKVVLGGSHFGSIGEELLGAFSAIDYVVSGEAEVALLAVLRKIEFGRENLSLPDGVVYRENGKVVRGERLQGVVSLESLPTPRYDFISLDAYFQINPRQLLLYEGGRGCVFSCSFCYSPSHYGRSVRDKSPSAVVRDLKHLAELGAKHIFFVQDNFLNSPEWAQSVCDQLALANLPITWSCYATLPQLSPTLVERFRNAKCIGIFFGIDAITPSAQARLGKHFARNWRKTLEQLELCIESGILPTCAFILEPHSGSQDVDDTLRAAIDCRKLGCDVHLNTLVIYSNTQLSEANRAQSGQFSSFLKPQLLLDTPPFVVENTLAEQFPNMFPYHVGIGTATDWQQFIAGSFCVFSGIYAFPQSLETWLRLGGSFAEISMRIDARFVAMLLEAAPPARRELALRWLAAQLSRYLVDSDRHTLTREVAAFILSSKSQPSLIKIIVDGKTRHGLISSHLNVRGKKVCEFLGERSAPSLEDLGGEFALRVGETIRFLHSNSEFGRLVEDIALAAREGKSLTVDPTLSRYLEDSGWISFYELST